jgi:hypothetical protein
VVGLTGGSSGVPPQPLLLPGAAADDDAPAAEQPVGHTANDISAVPAALAKHLQQSCAALETAVAEAAAVAEQVNHLALILQTLADSISSQCTSL